MGQRDAEMRDAEGVEDEDEDPPLLLSEKERRVLELYDQLQELNTEAALLTARSALSPDPSHEVTERDIKHAQKQLLESRASHILRDDVVGSVMMVNPIIKAVHQATDASPIERDLLPHIEQRDAAAKAIAEQDAEIRSVNDELEKIQVESNGITRRNATLAAEVLELAAAASRRDNISADSPEAKGEISRLEAEAKTSKQKWKIIKGTASAVVAGSGVDWVSNQELRDIVLDPD